ncbi:MAG: Crp/Fnr family transcriptional regulator [Ferruginibacter sp.]
MKALLSHILQQHSIDASAIERIENSFKIIKLSKGAFLLEEGQVCRHLYFLESGCLRGYYNIDGREVTQWFGFENNFVTSFRSFTARTASVEYIQALEDAVLWAISYADFSNLLQAHPGIERFVRLMYEHYYIKLEERYSNAHFKTASERYEDLIRNYPHILQRIPLGHIASYLGISPETLSRVRKRS